MPLRQGTAEKRDKGKSPRWIEKFGRLFRDKSDDLETRALLEESKESD